MLFRGNNTKTQQKLENTLTENKITKQIGGTVSYGV